jgi:hypothetical protein
MRGPAAVCFARRNQLLCSQFGHRNGFHVQSFVQLPGIEGYYARCQRNHSDHFSNHVDVAAPIAERCS